MPRPVKVKESYAAEATRLQRLARGVLADKRRPESWRTHLATLLNDAAILMLQDEQAKLRTGTGLDPLTVSEDPATMALSREERNRRRRVARSLAKAKALEAERKATQQKERRKALAKQRKAKRDLIAAEERMAFAVAMYQAVKEHYEEEARKAAGKKPRKPKPPRKPRKPSKTKIEREIDIGLSVATTELHLRHSDIPVSYSLEVNGDDSIDGEIVGRFRDPMPDETSQWLLTAEIALAMPSTVWLSVAFVVFFPPRTLPSQNGKNPKKKGSPGWRRAREGELIGAEYTRKLYWQRWSEKGLHFHGARRVIESMIKENPVAMIRRIKVRIYWAPDGERPSKSRLR